MNKTIIGADFSINKPAFCILKDNTYNFLSVPFGLPKNKMDLYNEAGVSIIERTDKKYKGTDSSEKIRWEVQNANYLGNLIAYNLFKGLDTKNVIVVFEGFSFASKGNVAIQLGGYKYILMTIFNDYGISWDNMITYPPISIKKAAECAKKGMGKKEMIDAFIENGDKNKFRRYLINNRESFLKKTGTYIDHLDDLIDSYWAIKTYFQKNP